MPTYLQLAIQYVLEIHYTDIRFKYISTKLKCHHNSASHLRSQQTWRSTGGLGKKALSPANVHSPSNSEGRLRQEDSWSAGVPGCSALCRLGVHTNFGLNVVNSWQQGTTRFSKEGWISPGQKWSRSKLPCRLLGKKSPQRFPGSGSLGAQVKLYFSNNTVNGVFYKTFSHLILMMASKDGVY